MRVLVVGAGPTGALVSELLCKFRPISVSIWEKSRGCGGRMTTTRFQTDYGSHTADIGAQYISSTPIYQQEHRRIYDQLLERGVITPMKSKEIIGEESHPSYGAENKHFVCPNGISSIAKHFIESSGATLFKSRRLTSLVVEEQHIVAKADNGQEEKFDCVILTIPVPQVLQLDGIDRILDSHQSLALQGVQYSSRYALAIKLPDGFEPPVSWTIMYVRDDPCIRYIGIDTRKRDQGPPHTLVVQTSVPYGLKHLEEDKEVVGEEVLESLMSMLPWLPGPKELHVKSHKWRFSQIRQGVPEMPGCLTINDNPRVVLCGDAFTHSNFDGCISSALKTFNSLSDLFE